MEILADAMEKNTVSSALFVVYCPPTTGFLKTLTTLCLSGNPSVLCAALPQAIFIRHNKVWIVFYSFFYMCIFPQNEKTLVIRTKGAGPKGAKYICPTLRDNTVNMTSHYSFMQRSYDLDSD